jgi:hypothetical protein
LPNLGARPSGLLGAKAPGGTVDDGWSSLSGPQGGAAKGPGLGLGLSRTPAPGGGLGLGLGLGASKLPIPAPKKPDAEGDEKK